MLSIVILIVSLIVMTLLGHLVHMAVHSPKTGIFYKAHADHHFRQYPPNDLVSTKYRNAGANSTTIYFLFIFSPLIISVLFLTIFGVISTFLGIGLLIDMAIVSYFNSAIHDALHIEQSFWHRFWFFKRVQYLHNIHHFDTSKNFGIFYFFWDKLFGTYKE
jgi:sterol desaturase/sphingolipid hydroxylase (fatty acid hydroxylase superfamily)